MHRTTLLLLACISTVFGNLGFTFTIRSSHKNVDFSTQEYVLRTQTKNPIDGTPSKYLKALDDFEDATFDVQEILTLNKKDINFIALMYSIAVLSRNVAQDGWTSYDDYYSILAESLAGFARTDPDKAIETLNCYMYAAEQNIERMRILMTNERINKICTTKPAVCDSEIDTTIKMSNDADLLRKSELLLALGHASSVYMELSDDIHAWSRRENYMQSQDMMSSLKPLVEANSIVHKLIFRREDKCSD